MSTELYQTSPVQTALSEELDIPSNHCTLCTTIFQGRQALYGRLGRFKLDKADQQCFPQALEGPARLLDIQVNAAWSASQDILPSRLDALVTEITTAIHTALLASTLQAQGLAQGYPW